MIKTTRALPLVLAALTAAGCVVPLGAGSSLGQPPVPTAPPVVAPVVAGVPVVAPGTGPTTLRAKQSSVDLTLGEERPLAALVVDANGLVQTSGVTWLSSNPAVLTINPTSGQAKGLAAGTAVVIASSQANPTAQAQIEVRVTEKQLVKQIVVDPASPRLEDGGKVSLTAQVFMADGTINGNVKWQSSDETIATVTAAGEVRARKEGKVTIEAIYALDPRFKGIAVLTIGNPPATATTPATGTGSVAPGALPGEEVVMNTPKGKWIAQALDGITTVSGVFFRDAKHGLLMAAEGLFQTSDAGTTWTLLAAPGTVGLGNQVQWFDADTAISSAGGNVLRTTDGGATWTKIPVDPTGAPGTGTPTLYKVQVVGPLEAYALNIDLDPYRYYANIVYHTRDGGETWAKETVEAFAKQNVAAIVRVGGALVALAERGVYRLDPDEGGWTKLDLAQNAGFGMGYVEALGAMAVVPGTETVFTAGPTHLMRSDNAGKTWVVVPDAQLGSPHTLTFADAQAGLAIAANDAWTTNDGGKTWNQAAELSKSIMLRNGSRLHSGARLTAERGYVVSHENKLFRFVYP